MRKKSITQRDLEFGRPQRLLFGAKRHLTRGEELGLVADEWPLQLHLIYFAKYAALPFWRSDTVN